MEVNRSERARSPSQSQTDTPATKQPASAPESDRDAKTKVTTASTQHDVAAALRRDGDGDAASTFAQSTTSGYTPSYSSRTGLLLPQRGGRRRSSVQQDDLRKTTGRKAYLGACKALDLMFPIDYNEDATSMRDSSVAKLARTLKNA
jgi:hypothetical protein